MCSPGWARSWLCPQEPPSELLCNMRLVVDGVNFEVADQGSGHVVLLLHGFPDSAKLWKHQARACLCRSLSP